MNWLDWILLAVLALGAYAGLRNGLSGALAMAAIVVVAMLAARPLAGVIEGALAVASGNPLARRAAAYVMLVALGLLLAALFRVMLARWLRLRRGGRTLEWSAGAVIGMVVSLVALSAIVSGFVQVAPDGLGEWVQSSAMGRFLTGPFNDLLTRLGLSLP